MRVVVSAGGTGGHIYPALAIIEKIKEKEPDSEFLYIGTHNRMEKDIVPACGIPFKSIEIYGFNKKNLLKNIKTIKCIFKSFRQCKKIIKDFNPDIVIGVGGYVTVPVIVSAKKLGYKTFLHEQNGIPGKSNRYLSKYADAIGVSFTSSMKYLPKEKTFFSGNPCSESATLVEAASKAQLGLSANKKLLLITMGSLGSKTVNDYLASILPKFENKNYEVLIITGKSNYDDFMKNTFPSNVKVLPFYDGLTKIMKRTDLMVSRAGASTLSEIIALELPAILIPSPFVANNHQYINSLNLTENNAAIMIEEKNLKDDILVTEVDKLINDDINLHRMKENLKKIKVSDSASIIYDKLKELIK